jgi:hypothetical protein
LQPSFSSIIHRVAQFTDERPTQNDRTPNLALHRMAARDGVGQLESRGGAAIGELNRSAA